MKIGIDARCLEWQRGGVARYLLNMLHFWPKLSNEHQYFLYFQNYIPDDDVLKNPNFTLRLIRGPKFLKRRRVIAEQILMPLPIMRDNLDLFYATWYTAPLLLRGVRTVVAAWDISYSTHPRHYSFVNRISLGWFSRISTQKAAGTITCSDFDADQIEKYYKIPRDEICTLYLSADDKFNPKGENGEDLVMEQKYGISAGCLLYMGLIYQRRSVDVLIRAFEKAREKIPELRMIVVGRNKTEPFVDIACMMQPLVENGTAKYVEWIPETDMTRLYRHAKFYTCTSTVDGESIMLKEAMKSGTPVITSKLLADSVGKIGYVIEDPTDVGETAATICAAFSASPSEYQKLVDSGLEWTKRFSWEKVAIDSLRFIESRK